MESDWMMKNYALHNKKLDAVPSLEHLTVALGQIDMVTISFIIKIVVSLTRVMPKSNRARLGEIRYCVLKMSKFAISNVLVNNCTT